MATASVASDRRRVAAPARAMAAMDAVAFLSALDRLTIAPLLVAIGRSFEQPLRVAAVAATVHFVCYGVAQPFHGVLSDNIGRIRALRLALVAMAAGSIASSAAPNLATLVVARGFTGAASGALVPAALVYLGETMPDALRERSQVDIVAALGAGTALATALAAGLAIVADWRAAFIPPAAIALLLAAALGAFPDTRPAAVLALRRRVGLALEAPWAVSVFLLAIPEGAVVFGFSTFFATALEEGGHSTVSAGLAAGALGVGTLLSAPAVRLLVGRTSAAALIGIGALASTIGYAAATDTGFAAVLLAATLAGVGQSFMHSTLQRWATTLAPEARGTATSLFAGAVFAGAAAAAVVAGQLAGQMRFPLLFAIAAGVSGLGGASLAFARRRAATPAASELLSAD
jgi:predicted MFS family arabinose efflux permease